MNKKGLCALRKAVRSVNKPEHTFFISGKQFSCTWDGHNFLWTAPSGSVYKMSKREVIRSIGNGEYIENYCFDYVYEEDKEYAKI